MQRKKVKREWDGAEIRVEEGKREQGKKRLRKRKRARGEKRGKGSRD